LRITCPYGGCGEVFEWKPPSEKTVMREIGIDSEMTDLSTSSERKRYVVKCPKCNRDISVWI
jgi:hypothetical protein